MRIGARAFFAAALVGCGIDAVGTLASDGAPNVGPDGKPIDGSTSANEDGASGDSGGPSGEDGGQDGTASTTPLIYVSTLDQLWSWSPLTHAWKFLATTSASCPTVEELAVNAQGEIWAVSWTLRALYKIDPQTYACAKVGAPNSSDVWSFAVTFVPKEVFDAGTDTLVGYVYRDYIRIDPNGHATIIGGNGLDPQMQPSGDMVAMGTRAFVSINGVSGCTTEDCLVETDTRTGLLVKNWGAFPSGGVFALGHWAGKIYGFKSTGEVYEVTLGTSSFTTVTHPGPATSIAITGAGSTTTAPTQ